MKNAFDIRGDATVVFLPYKGRRLECLVDTCDLEAMKGYRWAARFDRKGNSFYCHAANLPEKKFIQLHRLLTNSPPDMDVDHINHDGLDNRRSVNLRVVTKSVNQLNRISPNANNRSGYRGVTWRPNQGKWEARVRKDGKLFYLGLFLTRESAGAAACAYRLEIGCFS